MLRLRGGWTVVDPSVARKARSRLIRTVQARAGRGRRPHRPRRHRRRPGRGGRRRQPAEGARAAARRRDGAAAPDRPPVWRPRCATTSARASPGSSALTSLGLGACLADDMGLGKTVTLIALHLHRAAAPPGPDPGGLPGLAPRQLGGRDPALRPRRRRTPLPRRPALARRPRPDRCDARPRLRPHHLRHRPARRRPRSPPSRWGLVVADEAQHVKNARSATARALRTVPSHGARRPHRHPRGEQPDRALGDPRLGDARAARQPPGVPQGVGRPDRVGPRADQGPAVRRPDRPVPPASPQDRPRHRARAARQDRDRPPARADPRAGRPLRVVRARHHGPHRARRRADPARPGAQAAHRPQADLQPPGPLPQAVRRPPDRPVGEARPARRARSPPPWPRTARCWSSPSTSRWPG